MTKILLVEDDKSLREIYGVRLLAEGYDIVSAGDGEEALAMAIKDRPDLILSDVMMPKISGFDMLDILRSTTETKDIKVIMMTALSSEEQRQRGVALGADRYLVKSQVGIEDVVRTVHEVLTDAPVSGATAAIVSTPAPQPPAPNPAVPVPPMTPPAPTPTPVSSPAPAPAPMPVVPPVAPLPVSPLQPSTLPSPTAPLTPPPSGPTVKPPTLASRVIEPLPSSAQQKTDFSNLISQELAGNSPAPAPLPTSPAPTPPPSGLQFEETPLPGSTPASPSDSPTQPATL